MQLSHFFVATEIIYGLVIPAFVGVSVVANALICCVLTFTGNGNGKESSLSFDRVTTFIKLGLGGLWFRGSWVLLVHLTSKPTVGRHSWPRSCTFNLPNVSLAFHGHCW